MILFFYGPNDYLINKKLTELKDRYATKWGELNLVSLDGETLSFEQYSSQTQAMPLLATSRLMVIDNIFANKNKETLEKIKTSLDRPLQSTVVVFIQKGMPDKRMGLFKALNKPKIAQEFKALDENAWRHLAREIAKENSTEIETQALTLLFEYVADDLWRLENEIKKLSCYTSKAITPGDVEDVVTKSISSNIFSFIDHLTDTNKKIVLKNLQDLLDSSEPPLKILAMVGFQLRSLCQVKEALEQSSNSYTISKMTSLAPFQVGKMIASARRFSWQDLSMMYQLVADFDENIKTGKIEGKEALKELVLSI